METFIVLGFCFILYEALDFFQSCYSSNNRHHQHPHFHNRNGGAVASSSSPASGSASDNNICCNSSTSIGSDSSSSPIAVPVTIESHVSYNSEYDSGSSSDAALYASACSSDLNNFSSRETAQLMRLGSIEEYDSDDTIINNQSNQYANNKVFSICDRVINHNQLRGQRDSIDNVKISNQFDSDYDKLIVG